MVQHTDTSEHTNLAIPGIHCVVCERKGTGLFWFRLSDAKAVLEILFPVRVEFLEPNQVAQHGYGSCSTTTQRADDDDGDDGGGNDMLDAGCLLRQ